MAYRNVTGMLPVHLFSSKVGAIIVTLYLVIPIYVHLTKHPPPAPTTKNKTSTDKQKRSDQRFEPAASYPEAILPGHLEEFDQVHTLTQFCYHGNLLDVAASSRDTES